MFQRNLYDVISYLAVANSLRLNIVTPKRELNGSKPSERAGEMSAPAANAEADPQDGKA